VIYHYWVKPLPGSDILHIATSFVLTHQYSFQPLDAPNYHIIISPPLISPTTVAFNYKKRRLHASMAKDEVPLLTEI
jgi:hypothetical protein